MDLEMETKLFALLNSFVSDKQKIAPQTLLKAGRKFAPMPQFTRKLQEISDWQEEK